MLHKQYNRSLPLQYDVVVAKVAFVLKPVTPHESVIFPYKSYFLLLFLSVIDPKTIESSQGDASIGQPYTQTVLLHDHLNQKNVEHLMCEHP